MRMDTDEAKRRLQNARQEFLTDPAQGEAGESDAKLCRREIGVEMGAHVLGKGRLRIAFVFECIELTAAYLHNSELARDEKRVQDDEPEDDRDLAEQERR